MKRNLYFALLFVTILLFTGCKKNTIDTLLQDTNTNCICQILFYLLAAYLPSFTVQNINNVKHAIYPTKS
ncbi:MAG: hypothetical protein E6600_04110 [Anaerocolumna aminovalerica]|uniref:hypothetical protein n=1 Tax=Anaerocolumna aminovalerica TaxID=1527 RepID=UPI00290D7096|nr:hypothetical protein [Anaerocolumna aminovalerica]MDU6263672.1 hypothetical protein [Anaerocolumna aminovalerica]